jgi:DNA modification methylase
MGREPSGNERPGSNWIQPFTRNARSVWTITTKPFSEAHFATMPVELAQRCIRAGSKAGDTVLDPFAGAGTTLLAASGLARQALGIELNPTYAEMARRRCDSPLFTDGAA